MRTFFAPVIGMTLVVANAPPASLEVDVTGLRDERGTIHACLTRAPSHFPNCKSDPAALTQTIPAGTRTLTFRAVQPGDYAIAIFHDANSNRKLDTFMGIPKEGFGFRAIRQSASVRHGSIKSALKSGPASPARACICNTSFRAYRVYPMSHLA